MTHPVQEDALVRAHEKAMERYVEGDDHTRRPDLGQRIADYHLALITRIGNLQLILLIPPRLLSPKQWAALHIMSHKATWQCTFVMDSAWHYAHPLYHVYK